MTDLCGSLKATHCLSSREIKFLETIAGMTDEIERLRKIESAARNLVAQKGRHHTEQAYEQLAALIKDVK